MSRKWLLASLAGTALVVAAAIVALPARSAAEAKKTGQAEIPPPKAGELPIAQVVLFSSGVGYFQREGTVTGNQRIDLSFPMQDINDLLKSMVLRDQDGGYISTVSYDSNAPVEKTLRSFAINLTGNPTFGQILNQARGEKMEVVMQQGNAAQPATMTGSVVGVERKKIQVDKAVVEVELLNLWCADGMRSIKMSDVQRVRFLNPTLDSEFRKALETLTLTHDTQKKSVSLNCVGEGERHIKVGYVIENPIWKTSYRLVLSKAKEEKPFLQGWAVVENPSDEDWKDVRMALVSGRPISFQMDLYQPLFVKRPVVELELFASLRPPTYNSDLALKGVKKEELRSVNSADSDEDALNDGLKEPKKAGAHRRAALPGLAGARPGDGSYRKQAEQEFSDRLNLNQGVQSAASAAQLGDFFQYVIDKPVTLPRQKSALLPIANKDVDGTRVSIYNERTQAKFPLLGLKLKNTSGLHLMQGPITVFEGSNYAGDARILDLQPNEERLISYAIDLGTEVNAVPSSDNGRLTALKVVNGILYTTTKLRESKAYTIANRNDSERLVLLEHPVRNEFTVVETAKPSETASDVYRFQLKVPAGKTSVFNVTEERNLGSTVSISNTDDNQIRFFINQAVASPKLKQALGQAVEMKAGIQKVQRDIQEQQQQLNVITTDQARLRANLKEMPPTAAAYKRYLEKFDLQETQIEKYQAEIKKLQGQEHDRRKAFESFLVALNVE